MWSFELNDEACGSDVNQEEVRAVTSDFISLCCQTRCGELRQIFADMEHTSNKEFQMRPENEIKFLIFIDVFVQNWNKTVQVCQIIYVICICVKCPDRVPLLIFYHKGSNKKGATADTFIMTL